MSKYRIIKVKGYDSLYMAQKRVLFFFWENMVFGKGSIETAQLSIEMDLQYKAIKRANPRNIVVKTIKG